MLNLGIDLLNLIYPVGSIYMNVNNTNPSVIFGGTWTRWGNGRVPVGVDTGQTEFNTVEKTGGHKLMQAHTHTIGGEGAVTYGGNRAYFSSSGPYGTWAVSDAHAHASSTGGGNAQNLQPYITCYMWKRTA